MRSEPKSVSADNVCSPIQDHLEKYLPTFLDGDLERPYLWRQLPTEDAMNTVNYPAVAVATAGTVEEFEYVRSAVWGVWRVVVAFWVADLGWDETTSSVRRYVANGRDCLLAAKRSDWRVTGEDYSRIVDPSLGQTLGGGRIYLRVKRQLADLNDLSLTPGETTLPVVTEHHTTITLKEE